MQDRKDQPEVVIIGAGPVGLCTGIQLVEEKKDISVLIIEKNVKYLRSQRLKLDVSLIKNKKLQEKIIEKSKKLEGNFVEIPIQDLENCLLSHAEKIGIKIAHKQFLTEEQFAQQLKEHKASDQLALESELKYEVIVGIDSIKKNYPQCKIVIGADGSRSAVRDIVVDEKADSSITKTDLRNMIELKYQVKGKTQKLSTVRFYLTQALLGGFLCSESVSYNKEKNTSEITLRFLVDSETYNDASLKGINAKNLLPLHRHIPFKLYQAINAWINTRNDKEIILGSPTLNKTQLSIFTSKKYASEVRDILVLLVGDASCGFPFMNGLNLGIKNSKKLTDLIVTEWEHLKKGEDEIFEKLVKAYTEKTANTYREGSRIVEKANRKIDYQESSVQSLYYSTYPIKGSIMYMQSGEHEIFSAHELLKLKDLHAYKNKIKKIPAKYQLCCDLESELKKADHDVARIKKALYSAYLKNKSIEAYKNNGWLNYFFGKSQSKNLWEEEVKSDRLAEIPQVLQIHNGVASQQLHEIIYDMYEHVIRFEALLMSPVHDSYRHLSL